MDEQIVIDSQAYLRGSLTDLDYKAILYAVFKTSRNSSLRTLGRAIVDGDKPWLTILARNIVSKAGE